MPPNAKSHRNTKLHLFRSILLQLRRCADSGSHGTKATCLAFLFDVNPGHASRALSHASAYSLIRLTNCHENVCLRATIIITTTTTTTTTTINSVTMGSAITSKIIKMQKNSENAQSTCEKNVNANICYHIICKDMYSCCHISDLLKFSDVLHCLHFACNGRPRCY
jgi:hypothetical protein